MGEKGEFRSQIEGVASRTDGDVGGGRGVTPAADLFGEVLPPAGADVASTLPQPRGGRPKGAVGKRSTTLARYFAAKGYRDPAAGLAELASADPLDLWAWFGEHDPENRPSLIDVVRLQAAVRRDLLPFVHAKVPPKVDKGDRLAVMILSGGAEQSDEDVADEALSIEGVWSDGD